MREEFEPQPANKMPAIQSGKDGNPSMIPDVILEGKSTQIVSESLDEIRAHRFECRSCGYVYDPGEGIKKFGIEAGTPFIELDETSFRCPVCRSKMGAFKDIGARNKPSGFEENLNYGLGVNRLTPGQKNVLIFGGFGLAFAFFLSLYSLR
uniref:Rubredoxin n=1 Tax=Paulinella longichromatophora TaxID=1708747 RepID=A0A2H4ZPN3_9EUKA|nr:rubredoxin [Paulinella longichromatophora]